MGNRLPMRFRGYRCPNGLVKAHRTSRLHTVGALRNNKPEALHQKLNGFRKKNKLDIPALGLDQVKSWF